MAILTKPVTFFRCNVCGYEWQRKKKKSKGKPRICPTCKNPKWNKPVATEKSSEQLMTSSDRQPLNQ